MTRPIGDCGSVRALNARDFAEQFPAIFIDDHDPILPRNV